MDWSKRESQVFCGKLGQRSAAFEVPVGYVYLVLPLSGLLLTYYAALGARDTLRGTEAPADLSGASDTPAVIRQVG